MITYSLILIKRDILNKNRIKKLHKKYYKE